MPVLLHPRRPFGNLTSLAIEREDGIVLTDDALAPLVLAKAAALLRCSRAAVHNRRAQRIEAAAPVKAKTPEAKNLLQQRTPSKPPAVQAAALSNVLSQFSAARETGKYEKEKD